MHCAGFLLAGGRSSRMGSNKALLPFKGKTLIEHIAAEVSTVTHDVTLIGDSRLYVNFGYPIIQDIFVRCGPLSGIHAALHHSTAERNLIVACDMPEITAEFLSGLIERAEQGSAEVVLPVGPSGLPEPLCAVYHARALPVIEQALRRGVRKVTDGLQGLAVELWHVPDSRLFHNLNTPEDWAAYSHA